MTLDVAGRGNDDQRQTLAGIFLDRLGGEHILALPWISKPSELIAIHASRIEIDHTPRRQWFRNGKTDTVRVARAAGTEETVTCGIPGHHEIGEELVAENLTVSDGPLDFDFSGTCAFSSGFSYRSHRE